LYVLPLHTAADGSDMMRRPSIDELKLCQTVEFGQHDESLARQRQQTSQKHLAITNEIILYK
jgi:hypothetical protein